MTEKKSNKSVVRINAKVTAPDSFRDKSLFVTGMAFPYGHYMENIEVMIL